MTSGLTALGLGWPDRGLDRFCWRPRPGGARSAGWLEWWYYKAWLPDSREPLYLAYGVVDGDRAGASPAPAHAFLTAGLPARDLHLTQRLPLAAARPTHDGASLAIGDSVAAPGGLSGALEDAGHRLSWSLELEQRWSFTAADLWARLPGSSGIHWHPTAADARLSGALEVDGERLSLDGVPAYHDHNWGTAYPRWWFWLHCNGFDGHPDSALVAGGGRPHLGGWGELVDLVNVGLRHQGRVYAFRKHHLHLTFIHGLLGGWWLQCTNATHRIVVEASAPLERYHRIELGTPSGGVFHNHETLQGRLEVQLFRRQRLVSWRPVARLRCERAGIEYGSDPDRPVQPLHRAWLGLEPGPARGPFGVL